MAEGRIKNTELSAIAAAIRSKNGESTVYKPAEMAQAIGDIPAGYPEPTGTINITQNGTSNVKDYASANVNVPNSYGQSDEGKVVSGGELVAQTARTAEITANGTYDTTTNNSVTVNVSGGGGGGGGSGLPAVYQEVEYLSMSGSQYCTHAGPQIAAGQYIYAQINSVSTAEKCIMGIASGQSSGGSTAGSGDYFEFYQSSNDFGTENGLATTAEVTVSAASSDDRSQIKMFAIAKTPRNLFRYFWFFRYRVSGSQYYFSGKVYRIYVSDNVDGSSRTHDFVPCYRKSDNEPGLYDVVNNIFYTNEGTGSFGVGPDVS